MRECSPSLHPSAYSIANMQIKATSGNLVSFKDKMGQRCSIVMWQVNMKFRRVTGMKCRTPFKDVNFPRHCRVEVFNFTSRALQ